MWLLVIRFICAYVFVCVCIYILYSCPLQRIPNHHLSTIYLSIIRAHPLHCIIFIEKLTLCTIPLPQKKPFWNHPLFKGHHKSLLEFNFLIIPYLKPRKGRTKTNHSNTSLPKTQTHTEHDMFLNSEFVCVFLCVRRYFWIGCDPG